MLPFSLQPSLTPHCWISAGMSHSTELCTSLPTGHLLSAILQLLLCFETERLAAGQPGLVFLSRLQADVCAHRQGWCSLPSPLGSAACRQAAGRACGLAVLPVWGSCPQRFESGSGAGLRPSGVMSPQRDEALDHHGHPRLK